MVIKSFPDLRRFVGVGRPTLIAVYRSGRTALVAAGGLSLAIVDVGMIGYFGVIRNATMRPPGAAFLFLPWC